MTMQITKITINLVNEGIVRAYVSIIFDNCFMVEEIRVMRGVTGVFVSFPASRESDGTHREVAFPANAETRRVIEQAILAEYKKVIGGSDQ
jgi:stage V sporulation protein G